MNNAVPPFVETLHNGGGDCNIKIVSCVRQCALVSKLLIVIKNECVFFGQSFQVQYTQTNRLYTLFEDHKILTSYLGFTYGINACCLCNVLQRFHSVIKGKRV